MKTRMQSMNCARAAGIVASIALAAPVIHASPPSAQEIFGGFEAVGEQKGWNGLPSRVRHVSTGMTFVLVAPGEAKLGSPTQEKQRDFDEEQYSMSVQSPFYLGETEVTIEEWLKVMNELPVDNEFADSGSLPVQGVSWYEAKKFVKALQSTGYSGWRLPTEVEWEFACRAGTLTTFSFGNALTPNLANYDGFRPYADGEKGVDRGRPLPVRSFPPNPLGLYEMHGNVWEWCEDPYVPHPTKDAPSKKVGGPRVLRGGAFTSHGKKVRSAARDGYAPSSTGSEYGVRLAVTVPNAG